MTDVVDKETRSRMMAGIRGVNTAPEMLVRRFLHARGFRYRLHDRRLPGRPDLVLPKWRAVVFVHGCFWHHHRCDRFVWPKSRPEFWRSKIDGNVERDRRNEKLLRKAGWKVHIVWECEISQESLELLLREIRGET